MICEAMKARYCEGCDAARYYYFKSEEEIEKNVFGYYENKKCCETLKRYKEEKNAKHNGV